MACRSRRMASYFLGSAVQKRPWTAARDIRQADRWTAEGSRCPESLSGPTRFDVLANTRASAPPGCAHTPKQGQAGQQDARWFRNREATGRQTRGHPLVGQRARVGLAEGHEE